MKNMLDNLNSEFEEMDMEELEVEVDGGAYSGGLMGGMSIFIGRPQIICMVQAIEQLTNAFFL